VPMLYQVDGSDLARLYLETARALGNFERKVRQGADLDNAVQFARYLKWSGVLKFLQLVPAAPGIDAVNLRWRVDELEREVQALWVGKQADGASGDDLSQINHKLDIIAAHIAKISK